MPDNSIEFLATLAGTNTHSRWLTLGNEGDAKIVLEADASQLGSVMRLATVGKSLLRITVEEIQGNG